MSKPLQFLIVPAPEDKFLLVWKTKRPTDVVVLSFPTQEAADFWLNIKGDGHYIANHTPAETLQ